MDALAADKDLRWKFVRGARGVAPLRSQTCGCGKGLGSLNAPAADDHREFFQAFKEGGELGEGESVGAVGEGFGGVVVSFEEDSIDACGYAGAGEGFDEFGLAAAGMALPSGDLDGVRYVEHHRIAELLKNRKRTHVHD